jgi:hypothetical protein
MQHDNRSSAAGPIMHQAVSSQSSKQRHNLNCYLQEYIPLPLSIAFAATTFKELSEARLPVSKSYVKPSRLNN